MKKKGVVYQLTADNSTAEITIYGDITSDAAVIRKLLGDDVAVVSAYDIKKEISDLSVKQINVYINSYGGEVAEALAIYTALKRHPAKIHTFCDGFACSAASIIFCAGDQRTMGSLAMLMIHNAMTLGVGNAADLRKAADDIEKITQSSVEAYKKVSNLSEKKIKEMMDEETWLTAAESLKYGFATDIADAKDKNDTPQQSALPLIRNAIIENRKQKHQPSLSSQKNKRKGIEAAAAFFGKLAEK